MPPAITSGPSDIGIRGPMRLASAPPRAASSSMHTVIGSVATPAARAPYPLTVCSCSTRKNSTAPSAAYTRAVTALAAVKVRSAKTPRGSIGWSLRRSSTTYPVPATAVTTSAQGASGLLPHSMRAKVRPPSASTISAAPSTSNSRDACGSRVSGTARWAVAIARTATGRLTRKIQRQLGVLHQAAADERADRRGDAAETRPGADGARPVRAHEGALDHREAARREQRGADALEHARDDQHLG